MTFLLLIGRISRILRPGPMAERLVVGGRRAIARLHPHRLGAAPALPDRADLGPGEPWDVMHAGRGGVIQAVDVAGLVREAQRADCVVMAARLVLDAPDWHDHVAVGLAEIVRFGAGSPQVARALPPVMGDLRHAVPPDRRAAVDERIALLDEAVAAVYPGPSRAPRPSCPTARASAPGRPSAGRSGRIGAFPGA